MSLRFATTASPPPAAGIRPPTLVLPFIDPGRGHSTHEVASLHAASLRVAGLLGRPGGNGAGLHGPSRYWLPIRTLLREEAERLGVEDEAQLWGGVVPHAFVGTKLISHPGWPGGDSRPEGWRDVPGIGHCTLPGWSVFTRADALAACAALLEAGPVRVKSPYARGGNDQAVFADLREAREWLQSPAAIGVEHGLVVERDLVEAATYGVGSARVGPHAIAYYGTQRTVRDHQGQLVYGGSRLTVFRGDLAQLHATLPHGEAREAVGVAMHYDRAVRGAYQVLASRCNYDVIVGHDRDGQRHCGVLEQSWRFGGASMAELLAMERFAQDPSRQWLVAETVESYDGQALPPGVVLVWPGDAESPCKYARIVDDGY
ncbi:DUF3182 family protein [Luteimonas sp. SDU82]|uniref:DUF3182 family protein n=1 Tax=Luteimonas sp. SDU82 TaxID=3422592 RepID=UPI003EB9232F